MKVAFAFLLLCASAVAQDASSSCLVLAANGPAKGTATWSRQGMNQPHMLSYLWGEFPKGEPFRSYVKDKDIDKLKAKGGRIIILDPQYTRDDLEKAKKDCSRADRSQNDGGN